MKFITKHKIYSELISINTKKKWYDFKNFIDKTKYRITILKRIHNIISLEYDKFQHQMCNYFINETYFTRNRKTSNKISKTPVKYYDKSNSNKSHNVNNNSSKPRYGNKKENSIEKTNLLQKGAKQNNLSTSKSTEKSLKETPKPKIQKPPERNNIQDRGAMDRSNLIQKATERSANLQNNPDRNSRIYKIKEKNNELANLVEKGKAIPSKQTDSKMSIKDMDKTSRVDINKIDKAALANRRLTGVTPNMVKELCKEGDSNTETTTTSISVDRNGRRLTTGLSPAAIKELYKKTDISSELFSLERPRSGRRLTTGVTTDMLKEFYAKHELKDSKTRTNLNEIKRLKKNERIKMEDEGLVQYCKDFFVFDFDNSYDYWLESTPNLEVKPYKQTKLKSLLKSIKTKDAEMVSSVKKKFKHSKRVTLNNSPYFDEASDSHDGKRNVFLCCCRTKQDNQISLSLEDENNIKVIDQFLNKSDLSPS